MPDIEINVEVAGADQAAEDLKNIGSAAKDTGSDIKTAGSNINGTTQNLSNFKTQLAGVVGAFTGLSTGVIGLVQDFTRLEQSHIKLETAQRRVETTAQAVEKAQKKYNDAVKEFGPNSEQARQALDKLKTTTEGHNIAIDRANLQQQKFNETLAEVGTNVVPKVIGVFGDLVSAIALFTTKGEGGVTLAGKLKQSFTDLVSGGSNVKGAMDTAGSAMGGLGTKAEAAGKSAGTLESEVVQLGAGVSQAVPGFGRFSGGITNTAVAAERSVGPLANIERSVASTAVEVGGAVAPLGAFAGGMTATGTAAEGVVGGLEAAAVSTGALETGAAAATAETVALGAGIGVSTIALAAFTAGIGLAVAAIVAYVFNIGGFRDATNAAIDAAGKFLAIGWEGFAKKFEPVTKAIEGAGKALGDLIGKAGEVANLNVSGQFGAQPAPGQALAPGGTQGTLDEVQKRINSVHSAILNVRTAALSTNPVIATFMGGLEVPADSLQSIEDVSTKMNKVNESMTPMNTGVKNSNENFRQMEIDSTRAGNGLQESSKGADAAAAAIKRNAEAANSASQAMKLIGEAVKTAGDAMANEKTQTDLVNKAMDDFDATTQKNNATLESYRRILGSAADQEQLHLQAVQEVEIKLKAEQIALDKNAESLKAYDAALQTGVPQQQAWTKGIQDQHAAFEQSIIDLNHSAGALQELDAELQTGQPQLIAYNQGWIDFNTKMDQAIVAANKAQGEFDAFIATLGTGKQALADFATGFTQGEQEIQKWATAIEQGTAKVEGQQFALDQFTTAVGVKIPDAIRTSIERQQQWTEIILATPAALQKLDDAANKTFQDVVQGWQKVFQATSQQDFGKKLFENLENQVKQFGTVLSPVTNTVAQFMAQMQTTMKQGIDRTQAELAAAVFKAPRLDMTDLTTSKQSLQRMMDDMNRVFTTFGSSLPAAAQKFQPLIAAINQFGQSAKSPLQVQQAIGLMSLAMDAAFNPMDKVKQAMLDQGLAAVGLARDANGVLHPIQAVGQNSQQATDPTQKMSDALSHMADQVDQLQNNIQNLPAALQGLPAKIDQQFTEPWIQGIGSVTSAMAGLIESINLQMQQGLATAGSGIDIQFVQPFLTGIGKITSAMAGLIESIQGQLSAIPVAFNQAFAKASSDAIGSMNTLVSNVASALSGFGPALQGITVAFNQAFARASSDAIGSINNMVTQIANSLSGFGPALQGITVAFNQAFARAAQDAAGSINQLAQTVQQDMQNIGASVNAIANVFNTVFQRGAQDAAGSINNLAQTVQQDMQNIAASVNAIASVFNTVFSRGAQDAAGSINNLARTVQQDMQNIGSSINAIASVLNTTFQRGAQDAAGSMNSLASQTQTAMQRATGAVQQVGQALQQLAQQARQPIVVNVDTTAAQNAINSLRMQLLQLQSVGQPGVPLQSRFAARGGTFALGAQGFQPVEQLHAAKGGSYIVTKPTRLANLTVGEGHNPELVSFLPGRSSNKRSLVVVTPLPQIKQLNAQSGGVYSPLAGIGFTPGGFEQSGGQPIEYPAGTMAPVQTVGQGGPQQGMPSEVGAGTILVGPGGQAQPGPVTAPPGGGPGGGIGGLIPGAPSTGNYQILPQTGLPTETNVPAPVAQGGIAQTGPAVPGVTMFGGGADVSPYEMASLTGQAVANETAPQQNKMQSDMSDLLAMVRRLIAKISMRDTNTNLVVDGQKMASTVTKYIGSNAYGGR